jgi:hypothetical protein
MYFFFARISEMLLIDIVSGMCSGEPQGVEDMKHREEPNHREHRGNKD